MATIAEVRMTGARQASGRLSAGLAASARALGWGLAALSSMVVALYSYRYFSDSDTVSPDVLANVLARPFLYLHVAGAATALLIGPTQYLTGVRSRWPRFHRLAGRVYAIGCLLGGSAGAILAFGSTAGPIATAGFASLGLCWVISTAQGWRYAMARRFDLHRQWMNRSFALTFAAVTLRVQIVVLPAMGFDFVDVYRASAFISWIPNLIVLEIWMRRKALVRGNKRA